MSGSSPGWQNNGLLFGIVADIWTISIFHRDFIRDKKGLKYSVNIANLTIRQSDSNIFSIDFLDVYVFTELGGVMNKLIIILSVTVSMMFFFTGCSEVCIECGDPVGMSEHPDGHFITPDDIKGRWYVIGTSMGPNGLTWGIGECPRQHYRLISVSEGEAVFEEIGSWINPEGQFTGINTMADITKPYSMEFTKTDALGPMEDIYNMPWTMFAIGSEPVEYLALYFCKPVYGDLTIEPFQGFDIVARTQDPIEIQEIENKVLQLAEEQGMFIENYMSLSQAGCAEIEDFEND